MPQNDKYFLGRMDLGTPWIASDYSPRTTSIQKHLIGGFSKLFKFEYQPMGFSWMMFADRTDFDRAAL